MIVDSERPCEHAQRLLAFRRPKNGHVTQRASASHSAGSFPRERMKIASCNEPPCAILQPSNDFQQATCPLARCAPALRRVGIGPAHLHHSRKEVFRLCFPVTWRRPRPGFWLTLALAQGIGERQLQLWLSAHLHIAHHGLVLPARLGWRSDSLVGWDEDRQP